MSLISNPSFFQCTNLFKKTESIYILKLSKLQQKQSRMFYDPNQNGPDISDAFFGQRYQRKTQSYSAQHEYLEILTLIAISLLCHSPRAMSIRSSVSYYYALLFLPYAAGTQLLSDQRHKLSRHLMAEMLRSSEGNRRLGLRPILCLNKPV